MKLSLNFLDVNKPINGSDIFFNGDANKWIKVANSLKARFYMHTKEYNLAYTYASLGIDSKSNNMYAIHGDVQGNSNLYYQFFTGSRGSELTSENTKFLILLIRQVNHIGVILRLMNLLDLDIILLVMEHLIFQMDTLQDQIVFHLFLTLRISLL